MTNIKAHTAFNESTVPFLPQVIKEVPKMVSVPVEVIREVPIEIIKEVEKIVYRDVVKEVRA